MNGILIAHASPGAVTCVVVGRLDGVSGVDLTGFKEILWCVDSLAARHPPPALARRPVTVFPLDEPGRSFTDALDEFILRTPNRLPSVFVTKAVAANAAAYEELVTELHAALESYHRARMTRQKDGFLWQQHVLRNLASYCARRVPGSWRGALSGLPAFVCGAGPSLDVSAPVLARVAPHGAVFSADSALRALSRRGVQADFAVSVDVAKLPEKCLPETLAPTRVVLSAVSPPGWAAAMPESSRFFLSSTQLTLDWLAAQGVARTDINVTESCGSTAIELAHYLGCSPIYLFGLDFAADAADPSKRHHAGVEQSIYTNSGYDAAQKQPLVPGNYVERIPTFIYGDWRALNARLAAWPAKLVVNVNDRGARLADATLVHPASFAMPETPASAKADLLHRLPLPGVDPEAKARALANLRELGAPLLGARGQLQAALDRGGPTALVAQLRAVFAQPGVGHILGAYSLKLMPHLIPPIEGDRAFWQTQLDELHALAELTQQAASSNRVPPS